MKDLALVDPAQERAHELVRRRTAWPEKTLWLNPPAGLQSPEHAPWRFWQPFFPVHRTLLARGWRELESEEPGWSTIVCYASKHKEETWGLLRAANSMLEPGGTLLFAVPNDYGAKSFQEALQPATYEVGRKSRLYQIARRDDWAPGRLVEPRVLPAGHTAVPGLFSWSAPDRGSQLLVEAWQGRRLQGPIADLGAGWGFLARHLDPRWEVHLFEADRRALTCARQNLIGRSIATYWCDLSHPEGWPAEAPSRFPTIVTNPPFHAGQREESALGRAFAAQARRHLSAHGELWLVGNSHLGYPRWLATLFPTVETLIQKDGFTVVRACL